MVHPPGWEVETQLGQPVHLVTPCLPWQDAVLAWQGYSSSPDGKGRRRYLLLDLGSHEQGTAAAKAAKQDADRAAAGCQLQRCPRLQQGQGKGQGQQGQQVSAVSGGAGEGGSDAEEEEAEEEAEGRAAKRQRTRPKPKPCRVREYVHWVVGLVMWGRAPIDPQTGVLMELLHVQQPPRTWRGGRTAKTWVRRPTPCSPPWTAAGTAWPPPRLQAPRGSLHVRKGPGAEGTAGAREQWGVKGVVRREYASPEKTVVVHPLVATYTLCKHGPRGW